MLHQNHVVQHTSHLPSHEQIMVTLLTVSMKIILDCYLLTFYSKFGVKILKYHGPQITAYNDHHHINL